VKLEDVLQDARDSVRRPPTTAHLAARRFYQKHLRPNRKGPSLVERAAHLQSPLAIEEFLKEVGRLGLKPKLLAQLRETCRVRLAELKGVLP
jgi:hypothetical protein